MESTTVLLVRHADVHNPKGIVYGRLPRFRLSELGVRQAERTAAHLASQPLAAIYASPQLRARQTARIIASHHPDVPLRVMPLLAEVMTSWQGQPSHLLDACPNPYDPLREPTDETLAQIYARMSRALRRVAERHPGQVSVCVSHADPIMILRVGSLGLELRMSNLRTPEFPAKGSITRFEFRPGEERPRVGYLDLGQPSPALAAT